MMTNFPTIILAFAGGKVRKVIRTAREAAPLLLNEWPTDDGEEFFTAVRICLEVLTGNTEPENLHEAIVRAAYEAGIAAITTDHRLGILRIYPVAEVHRACAPRNPAPVEPLSLLLSGRRRRQRKWLGRSKRHRSEMHRDVSNEGETAHVSLRDNRNEKGKIL
ncbi:DUF982 domain-containing protein [Rhizobium sp. 768_B6_N1_8]|jgi:hypothetical protein|uniref:DUF982 domain-containing protein n=1 Tax=unclassified Rhizobium TaxID=2613769 RepID=UPI003F247240